MKHKLSIKILSFLIIFSFAFIFSVNLNIKPAFAMPFYGLSPKDVTLRSSFYTSFPASSPERKYNIKLASSAIDKTLVDVGAEFSFNQTVGFRTIENGYKIARIIMNGKFEKGVGGGVCQVSSTLYNAILLSGLKITEYHPHSLPVSYVAPSFDAMVNSGSADLRFINNTNNPIIIRSYADDSIIKVEIYGECMTEKYVRKSIVKSEILPSEYEYITDDKNEYPELFEGENKVISYGKKGLISQGYIIKLINDKPISYSLIRRDKYKPTKTIIIKGTAPKDKE